jgi:glycosyltransferase involved in cell wall biosynthesis
MTRKRILFISNLYPNLHTPNAASFSRQQISALRNFADIDVIAPIPWLTRLQATIPHVCFDDGMHVYHPTYLYTPGIFRSKFGNYFLGSIRGVADMLLKTKNYDFIYASWLYPDGWAAAQLAKQYNIPLFVNVVGTDVNRLRPGSPITEMSLAVVNQAQQVIAVSCKLKEHLVALGSDPRNIEVVYNGVNRTIFRPLPRRRTRDELNIPEGSSIILFVGNLKKEKGILELAKAFALLVRRHPGMDLGLAIVGSGTFEQNMKKTLKADGMLDRVRFLGSRSLEEVAKWMNACDLFCLPSYMEGQPNVIIEALACQARIVATNVGGIPELDKGQGNLRLVDPKSVSQLELALDEMLSTKVSPGESSFISSWQENAARIYEIFDHSMPFSTISPRFRL